MRERGHRVHQPAAGDADAMAAGTFVPPTLIELDRVSELGREVFGPVLHVVRFARRELGQARAAGGEDQLLGVEPRERLELAQASGLNASSWRGWRHVLACSIVRRRAAPARRC